MTVHISVPVADADRLDLEAWAQSRGVPVGSMVAEAVAVYVQDQREIIAAVAEARADIAAGRVSSHEAVVAEFEARRAAASAGR
jgi:predicted transcriptional regulator